MQELGHTKRAMEILKQAKAEIDERLRDSEELVQRLSAKIVRVGSPTAIKSKRNTSTLSTDREAQPLSDLAAKCAFMDHELADARREISILTRALLIRDEQQGLEPNDDLKVSHHTADPVVFIKYLPVELLYKKLIITFQKFNNYF